MSAKPLIPVCQICGHKAHWLGGHLLSEHNMTVEEYLTAHEGAETISEEALAKFNARRKRRVHPPALEDLKVNWCGIPFAVNTKVPASATAPLPAYYTPPKYGLQGQAVKRVALCLRRNKPIFVHGIAGTGKDAFFQAWAHWTGTPCLMVQINPDVDFSKYLFSHEIGPEGTYYKEGSLLKALRDGYTDSEGGVHPYLIILTDLDRCTPEQGEHLRLILDSIEGRIQRPDGGVDKVLKGTRIVATANSTGSGAGGGGRYASAQVMDASILSRFTFKFEYKTLDWRDEEPIMMSKFPLLARHVPRMFTHKDENNRTVESRVGLVTKTLREKVKEGIIELEFGHRELSAWLEYAEILVEFAIETEGKIPEKLLAEAFTVILESIPVEDRGAIERLVNVHFTGGLLDEGDVSHISAGELHTI